MRIDIFIHNNNGLELDLLKHIIKLLKKMPTKEQFDAATARINAALDKIGVGNGSLSEAQETELLNAITVLGDKAEAISERSPDEGNP